MILPPDLDEFILGQLRRAKQEGEKAGLSMKYSAISESMEKSASDGTWQQYELLSTEAASRGRFSLLFFDLVGSTTRAMEIGEGKTYLTMHAYIPTVAYVIAHNEGHFGGFRGDGGFGIWGLTSDQEQVDTKAQLAFNAAIAIQRSIRNHINPILKDERIKPIVVGVGLDIGQAVVTRLRLHPEQKLTELTVFGESVNRAAKLADEAGRSERPAGGGVWATKKFNQAFPSRPDGKIKVKYFTLNMKKLTGHDLVQYSGW